MKAWRNYQGNVIEIDVDLDLNGNPILPPNTTVDARPEQQENHRLTVVGNQWVQIEVPVYVKTFEQKKQEALDAVSTYRNWYLEQPIVYDNVKFDADDQARTRLTQALVMSNAPINYLSPIWITFDNGQYPIADQTALAGLVGAVQTAFSTRFYECNTIRQQVIAAADETALEAITLPVVGTLISGGEPAPEPAP